MINVQPCALRCIIPHHGRVGLATLPHKQERGSKGHFWKCRHGLRRYAEPFTKIQYELDWTRGAEVDLGCGTMAVGDSTHDPLISKGGAFLYPDGLSIPGPKHPGSMRRLSYQWPNGQRNIQTKDPGFYNQRCPRSVAMVNY